MNPGSELSSNTSTVGPAGGRGLDHVVVAGFDLDRLADLWCRLGFTVSPVGVHPWGTVNRLVRLGPSFVELLAVADPSAIPPARRGQFSFGAFNRDALTRHGEGATMLALASSDPARDRAAFAAAGLGVHEPFGFEREALSDEGEARTIGFDLTFATLAGCGRHPRPETGFFTCRHRSPELTRDPPSPRHANTATALAAVVFVAPDPADFHEELAAFAGLREIAASSLGLSMTVPDGRIEVLTPEAFRWRHGAASLPRDPTTLRLAALRFAVADLGEAASQLIAGGFTVLDRAGSFVVAEVAGVAVAFEAAASRPRQEVP